MLTIVMYHYVRDSEHSHFPEIKGVNLDQFKFQLEHIKKNYHPVSIKDVIEARHSNKPLPENSIHLSFDDGLSDHYTNVFPLLKKNGMQASFFPIAKPYEKKCVLDVHKVHFVLGTGTLIDKLNEELFGILNELRANNGFPNNQSLYKEFSSMPHRYDSPDVVFFKRLLTKGLTSEIRHQIVNQLFTKYVSQDEEDFLKYLYIGEEQLQEMVASGMEIGGHGYDHDRFEFLDLAAQKNEIKKTLTFLNKIHKKEISDWIFAYPYGSYTKDTLEVMKEFKCSAALTTHVSKVDPTCSLLELPRINANDVPRNEQEICHT